MQSVTGGTVREDGNVYYVIGSADGNGEFLVRCKTIGQRNQLKGRGICFVEEAYKGDSTVNRGWAMYLTVGSSTTTTSPKWVKIAEEESVEGAWSLQQDLIRSLVKISTFTKHQQDNNAEFKKLWDKVTQIGTFDKHSHNNKSVLDNLTDSGGQILYKGKPINGSVYVYNEGADSAGTGLKWINPVDTTITSNGNTSDDIARLFTGTSVAYPGQTLRVINLDNSASTYLILGDDDELTPVFIGTTSLDSSERPVKFVTSLPNPSASCVNEIFCVLPPAYNGDRIGHFYKCESLDDTYIWKDLSSSDPIEAIGASITACLKKTWNTVDISVANPSSEAISLPDGITDRWGRTYVVRKFGGAPTCKEDGVLIKVLLDAESETVHDVIPFTRDDVFYGVFSETINGRVFTRSESYSSEAKFLTWETIANGIEAGGLSSLLKVGDVIALPNHSEFGTIQCDVIDYNGGLALFAKHSIGEFVYDGIEYGKIPATGVYESGKSYYRMEVLYNGSEPDSFGTMLVKYTKMTTAAGDYSVGEPIPVNGGIFISDGYSGTAHSGVTINDASGVALYGNADYDTSNIRQWISSYGSAGEWFHPRDEYDTLDPMYETRDGFLEGFEDKSFLSCVEEISIPDAELRRSLDRSDERKRSMVQQRAPEPGYIRELKRSFQSVVPVFILKK